LQYEENVRQSASDTQAWSSAFGAVRGVGVTAAGTATTLASPWTTAASLGGVVLQAEHVTRATATKLRAERDRALDQNHSMVGILESLFEAC
jgi:hypothetical protein